MTRKASRLSESDLSSGKTVVNRGALARTTQCARIQIACSSISRMRRTGMTSTGRSIGVTVFFIILGRAARALPQPRVRGQGSRDVEGSGLRKQMIYDNNLNAPQTVGRSGEQFKGLMFNIKPAFKKHTKTSRNFCLEDC